MTGQMVPTVVVLKMVLQKCCDTTHTPQAHRQAAYYSDVTVMLQWCYNGLTVCYGNAMLQFVLVWGGKRATADVRSLARRTLPKHIDRQDKGKTAESKDTRDKIDKRAAYVLWHDAHSPNA
jgi:hypothetical protein